MRAITLAILTVINILGVRSGSNTQTALMLLKLAAIVMLVVCGAIFVPHSRLTLKAEHRPAKAAADFASRRIASV